MFRDLSLDQRLFPGRFTRNLSAGLGSKGFRAVVLGVELTSEEIG